jgi:hypothetical protein
MELGSEVLCQPCEKREQARANKPGAQNPCSQNAGVLYLTSIPDPEQQGEERESEEYGYGDDAQHALSQDPNRNHVYEVYSRHLGGESQDCDQNRGWCIRSNPKFLLESLPRSIRHLRSPLRSSAMSYNVPRVSGQALEPAPAGPRGQSPSARYTRCYTVSSP